MVDPYKAGLAKGRPDCRKRNVIAELVVVLGTKRENRDLQLIAPCTRALVVNEIHELIITDEQGARPANKVDSIAYLGFAEIKQGGVIMVGDKVKVGNRIIGTIAGFDETHMPNHQNIVIRANTRKNGFELGVSVGEKIVIGEEN